MRISDWSSDVCSSDLLQHIVVADLGIDIAAELVARLDRREQHRAAGAAFTEQRSLRALQHLYTGQVIDLKILDCRIYVLADAAKRNIVEIGHNAGIAADRKRRRLNSRL